MPTSYRIIPEFDVVYVQYRGVTDMREVLSLFDAYVADPMCRPGQKQLVDVSLIAEPFDDYIEVLKLMARMADQFTETGPQTLLACYAPTPVALKAARIGQKSWSRFDHVVYRVMREETEALEFLGLPFQSISEMLIAA